MAAIAVFLGLISGTSLTVAGIIWYSSLFSNYQMSNEIAQNMIELIEKRSFVLKREIDWRGLSRAIPQNDLLLLSSSTRGSEELLEAQIKLTKNLMQAQRINFLMIDTDWHQIYPLNLYVMGLSFHHFRSNEVIRRAQLWPQWVISNRSFAEFIDWLRDYNLNLPWEERIPIYGISMNNPTQAIDLLALETEESAEIKPSIDELKSCFNLTQQTFETYAKSAAQGGRTCEQEAQLVLKSLEESQNFFEDRYDYKAYNMFELARVIISAEQYYQYLHSNPKESWNARSLHQANAITRLMQRRQVDKKMAIVWGEHSVLAGTLIPEIEQSGFVSTRTALDENYRPYNSYAIGLLAYEGEVLSASGIGQEALIYPLNKPIDNSLESALLTDSLDPYFLPLYRSDLRQEELATLINYRSISDVVNNEGEKEFYSPIALAETFDGVIFFPKVGATKTLTPAKKATN